MIDLLKTYYIPLALIYIISITDRVLSGLKVLGGNEGDVPPLELIAEGLWLH